MADNIKRSVSLGNGWTVHLISDKPYDDLIRVISPWGDHTNIVKNEEAGEQNLLWRYFATIINLHAQAPNTAFIPTIFPAIQGQNLTNKEHQ